MPALPALDSLGFIDDIPVRNAQRYGDKAAIVLPHGAVALTHAQLEARTDAMAAALLASGVPAGARVVIAFNNTASFFVALFGVLRAGAVAVAVDGNLSVRDLKWIIDNAQPVG
jgi:acyl-CoA synthetase (AMP-forming)/AMP-acid ligase II